MTTTTILYVWHICHSDNWYVIDSYSIKYAFAILLITF